MLGTRLWYPFFEEAVASTEAFMQQMDAVTRGKHLHPSLWLVTNMSDLRDR